jgi:hypothetical protein
MWINMNESILAVIIGGLFGTIVFVLPALIIRAVYRKIRAAKEKARLESQLEGVREEPSLLPKPASKRGAVIAFIFVSLLVIMWGLMFGFVIGVLSNLLYLVFVFPVVIGISNGSLIADAIEKIKIRKPTQVVILSILSAVAIYGMLHYGRYVGFIVQASLEISSDFSAALEDENLSVAKAFTNYLMQEETGHPGFTGYMLYKVSTGVSIGRLTRSSTFNLGPVLTVLYWLLELGIIVGLTVQKGRRVISLPFCESCGNQFGGEKHLGGTASANESFLLDLIRQKDFVGLRRLIEPNTELPSLEVYVQGCQVCGKSQSQLVVRHAFQGAKGVLQFTDATQTLLQPTESALLLSQLSFSGD